GDGVEVRVLVDHGDIGHVPLLVAGRPARRPARAAARDLRSNMLRAMLPRLTPLTSSSRYSLPLRMASAARRPLRSAGPIPSPRSRVASPAASPVMKALPRCTPSTLPRREELEAGGR